MAYTVLARKYRSWTFDELVGQEAVATTLKSAINCERIHHGFLFTGTRGVGKTSAARILARSLNCLNSPCPTPNPCKKCESCIAIAEGQDVDVIEIDAASNSGVENIRELRSNAIYRPARARFKIYIIDEVHMLSTGAFNALLKTLEEPPEHVKFILATTDPQKVPATIQSRCLRFDFRSISIDDISRHFGAILKDEGITAEEAVLRRVARLANGSMRDGLSLLDQLLASGEKNLTVQMIEDLLPSPHDEALTRLIAQVADHDAGATLVTLDACLAAGYSLERFADSLIDQLRTLMLIRVCGAETPLLDLPSSVMETMSALAQRFDSDAYVYMIAVLEELRRSVRSSAVGRALIEAALVRLASATGYQSVQSLLDQLATGGSDDSKKKVAPSPQDEAPAPAARVPYTLPPPRPAATPAPAARAPSSDARTVRPAAATATTSSEPRSVTPVPARPAPPRPISGPPAAASGESLKEAASEPLVRAAMELFDASLVNVEKLKP